MSKNIVVCCDGTGGQFGSENTNVVKLCEAIQIDPEKQVLFYDPGLGTFSIKKGVSRITRQFYKVLGLAFGVGLTQNMIEAYQFIMNNYEDGDHIYLFGFSRGAYTARAVAALIYNCGLLHPGSENLLPYAVDLLKRKSKGTDENKWEGVNVLRKFKRIFGRDVKVHFLGLWDTVTSIGWIWDPKYLPNTSKNPNVRCVRQALAIDERRAFFKQNLWNFDNEADDSQDVKQVWFAGVHGDVGGGVDEEKYQLSRIAFEWMLIEAQEKGLIVDEKRTREMLCPEPPSIHLATPYNSLIRIWWIAEIFPKFAKKKQANGKYKEYIRINLGRRRYIEEGAVIHHSAVLRKDSPELTYDPPNWQDKFDEEPWIKWRCYAAASR